MAKFCIGATTYFFDELPTKEFSRQLTTLPREMWIFQHLCVRHLVARSTLFIVALLYFAPQGALAQSHVNLKLRAGAIATAVVVDGKLTIAHTNAGGLQSFDLRLPEGASVAARHINQDTFPDIEVWHIDEGMGTYTIHYLFIYSVACNAFIQLLPKHSDAFMNLRLGRPGAPLYYSGYETHAHRWRRYSQRPTPSIGPANCSKLQSEARLER